MSNQYLTMDQAPPVPPYDPKEMAQGLGWGLMQFLAPLVFELDRHLDKRLVRTLVQSIEAILAIRSRVNGLLLSELGGYLEPMGKATAGSKRLSRLLHSCKWSAWLMDQFRA